MSFQFLEIIQAVQNLIKILFYFNSFHSEARADIYDRNDFLEITLTDLLQANRELCNGQQVLNTISQQLRKTIFISSSSKPR